MPKLDLKQLVAAGADGEAKPTSSRHFRNAYRLAQEFNGAYKEDHSYTEEQEKCQIRRLDKVLKQAGLWLTGKPLKREGEGVAKRKAEKNAARWQALANLCEQCSAELIAMGFRPLSGHWNGNPLEESDGEPNYWLERLDPKHRGASALKSRYATWAQLPASDEHYGKGFFEYVDADVTAKFLPSVRYDKSGEASQAEARRARRRESQVKIDGGKLHRVTKTGDLAAAYDTTKGGMKTEFAGDGFAIFVWDRMKRIFSGLHIANSLHHSTARGGRPVRCAGELRTNAAGKIVMITSKTGHYRTTPAEFKVFLSHLAAEGAITNETVCIPDTASSTLESWKMYAALDWSRGIETPKSKEDVDAVIPTLKTDLKSRNFYRRLA